METERKPAHQVIIDGLERGYLSIKWNLNPQHKPSKKEEVCIDGLIEKGKKLGFLIEVCSGCGAPTSGRDCGCPAGTGLCWNPKLE